MTNDELQAQLSDIQAELQEPATDKVSELVPFVEALTDEELVDLLRTVNKIQVSRGTPIYPASPEEIIAIIEAIKQMGDRPSP
jgi:hypothetical protein